MDKNSLFFQAFVYLSAAVVMVPLAKRIGLGSVLGYLLAGILIGPALLNLIGSEGHDLMHFAEFGVVMMLFLIGLELEPELLWKLRKSILGLGGLQVLITTIIITAISQSFHIPWQQGLALGMIIALSSTAIVLQTLNEKGLMKTSAGRHSFSVLLFQDIAVIPMLAFFPLLATLQPLTGGGALGKNTWMAGLSGWMQTLIVLAAVFAIIFSGRYLINPLLRIVASTRLREIFTASALLLVIAITLLMTQVGLSPALGTFLAGVVLANSEFRHELESDIEPFKGLLLGLFFIAVGASIDFQLVMQKPVLILGLVFLIMTIKGIVLLILGKLFKLRFDQNLIFGFALSQMGEFGFVLLSFSLQEGVLPKDTIDIMVAVVAISMAVTPLVILFNEKIIQPRFDTKEKENEREDDKIDEKNPVIIAGFGHFGNTIGRFLRANGVQATFLDYDSDRVDLLRKMGFKVYYGDASRHDLLRAAGADQAKIIVLALDNLEKRLEMIDTIKKHFPNLRILVRAENRFDAYQLMNAGMMYVYRETLDTSLRVGTDVLKMMGYRSYTVNRMARIFLKHDEATIKKLAVIKNQDEYVTSAKEYIAEIEKVLESDRHDPELQNDKGWDEESLIADATGKPGS